MATKLNLNLIVRTEDGDYVIKTDAEGKDYLEKVEREKEEEKEDDSALEVKFEDRVYKYVCGRNKVTGQSKLTLIVPSLRYLPYPPQAWPSGTHVLDHWLQDTEGGTVDVYTLLGGLETTLSFTSPAQRQVVHNVLAAEMKRRRDAGEKRCLTVKALLNRFCSH